MDKLQQVKDKLEEMKAKYVLEHEEEEYPLHSNGYGMWWSGFFSCLKEISSFVDHLEVKEVDLDKEIDDWYNTKASKEFENVLYSDIENCAKHFFELGLKVAQKGE